MPKKLEDLAEDIDKLQDKVKLVGLSLDKKSADLEFSCEDLFKDVEKELFATIDTEAETWECMLIE